MRQCKGLCNCRHQGNRPGSSFLIVGRLFCSHFQQAYPAPDLGLICGRVLCMPVHHQCQVDAIPRFKLAYL